MLNKLFFFLESNLFFKGAKERTKPSFIKTTHLLVRLLQRKRRRDWRKARHRTLQLRRKGSAPFSFFLLHLLWVAGDRR